jgi:predicted nucleotidyltransferase
MEQQLIDVSEKNLNIVQAILKKYVPHYEVWAFGSRVKGRVKTYSDLDLVIMTDKPLSFGVHGDLAEAFSESDLPWRVDIVDWATTSESFRKIIEQDKIILQNKN